VPVCLCIGSWVNVITVNQIRLTSSFLFLFSVIPLTISASLPVPSSIFQEMLHQKYINSCALKLFFHQSAFCLMLANDYKVSLEKLSLHNEARMNGIIVRRFTVRFRNSSDYLSFSLPISFAFCLE